MTSLWPGVPGALILLMACWLQAACVLGALPPPDAAGNGGLPPGLPNGVASGDVSQTSAVLWARAAQPGVITFTVTSGAGATVPITRTVADPMRPVSATLTGLSPGTAYVYSVTLDTGDTATGRFRTPAADGVRRGLRFGASGDVRGDLSPYAALGNAAHQDLDFFVMLGDSVYADIPSPALLKPAQTPAEFMQKQVEVLSTRRGLNTLAALRASTLLFATIDDHDVVNNFAGGMPAADSPFFGDSAGLVNETGLYCAGLEAFLAFHPLQGERYDAGAADARTGGRPKLYRYRTFGADAALYVLDTRSFRDAPLERVRMTDDAAAIARFQAASFDPQRTMLGAQQMADLQRDLLDAQTRGITWKFVVVASPIQQLDLTAAQDRWQGYAAERTALLRFIAEQGIANVIFITADIHGTVVNNLAYQVTPEAAAQPVDAWEVSVGPVGAYETYGLAMVLTYRQLGLLSEEDEARYWSLPSQADSDDTPDDRDDFVKEMVNRQLAALGYDLIGLHDFAREGVEGARLLAGDYLAGETYGWTEFAIDGQSQVLTVTTYGIPAYQPRDLMLQPDLVLAHTPAVVSQFAVPPQP